MYINRRYNFRDRNVIEKEGAEKIIKYEELTVKVPVHVVRKSKMIPVIIWGTGTTSKSFRI